MCVRRKKSSDVISPLRTKGDDRICLHFELCAFDAVVRKNLSEMSCMSNIVKAKCVLTISTALLASLCFINLCGEMKFVRDHEILAVDVHSFVTIALFWLIVPLANLLEGLATKKEKTLRMSLMVSLYYFCWMTYYALNGSPRNEWDYERRHLYSAPVLMAVFSPVVLYMEYCARRIQAWIANGARIRNEIRVGETGKGSL